MEASWSFLEETSSKEMYAFLLKTRNDLNLDQNVTKPEILSKLLKLHKKHLKRHGPEDRRTLLTLFNSAIILRSMNQPEKAEPYLTKVVEQFEKICPPKDHGLLLTIKVLAANYKDLGQYRKAMELYAKTLDAEREVAYHPEIIDHYIRNLLEMGRLSELVEDYQRALKYYIESYEMISNLCGLQHFLMWEVQGNMARVLFLCKNYEASLHLLEEVLECQKESNATSSQSHEQTKKHYEFALNLIKSAAESNDEIHFFSDGKAIKAFSPKETALNHQNLAMIYLKGGKVVRAQESLEKCLKLQRRIYRDENHEEILKTQNQISMILAQRGFHNEGYTMLTSVINSVEKSLGVDSPELIICKSNLAVILKMKGDPVQAYKVNLEAEGLAKKWLRKDDRLIWEIEHNMICLRISLGLDVEETFERCSKLVEIREHSLGQRHQDTLGSKAVLTTLYNMRGLHKFAIEELAEVYRIRTEKLGRKHPLSLSTFLDLLIIRVNAGGDLEDTVQECGNLILLQVEALGEAHPETLRGQETLGIFLKMLGRLSVAVINYDDLLKTKTSVFGWSHPETLAALRELGNLLERQGRIREACDVYREAYFARVILSKGWDQGAVGDSAMEFGLAFISAFKNCRSLIL